jgi:hypothetical protein
MEEKKLGKLSPILSNELIIGYPRKYFPINPPTTDHRIPMFDVNFTPPPSLPCKINFSM